MRLQLCCLVCSKTMNLNSIWVRYIPWREHTQQKWWKNSHTSIFLIYIFWFVFWKNPPVEPFILNVFVQYKRLDRNKEKSCSLFVKRRSAQFISAMFSYQTAQKEGGGVLDYRILLWKLRVKRGQRYWRIELKAIFFVI